MANQLTENQLKERLQVLRKQMLAYELDAVILMKPANIYYYSGFFGEDSWLLIDEKNCALLTDGRYTAQAALECPQCQILCQSSLHKWPDLLSRACTGWRIRNLGFEDDVFSFGQYSLMRDALNNVVLQPINDLASYNRQLKDETEIQALTKAAEIADASLRAIEKYFRVGVTEAEVARELNYTMYKKGAQGLAFPTIVAAGLNGAKPHAKPSDYEFQAGDLVTLDFGAVYNGYHGDMTRTVAIGEPAPKVKDIYNLVKQAQAYAVANLQAGMTCNEGDALARTILEEAGFGENFNHSLGHGTGLEIHELPWLRKNNEEVLRAGHVVTVEPGLYFPEWGGLRIEDTVVITEAGAKPLNHYPKDLLSF